MREMKDSGIDWIGRIPENWNVKTIDSCFRERNEKVSDYDWEALSVTKQGIVKQLENAAKSDAHDSRKKVCNGDFVINSRSDRKQSCGVSEYDGSVSLINIVLENKNLKKEYIKYLLKNYGFAEEFYRWGSGIVADLWSTNYQKMKKISIPIPPIDEQFKIGKELDKKIKEIDNVIEKTRQTIEDYKLYKQSIITKAVTKGIDDKVEMKNSGIDYIGVIPKHWRIIKLKYIAKNICKGNGITKEDIVIDGNIPCVRYGEIYSKYNYKFYECLTRINQEKVTSKQYFLHGDLLFAGTGELVEEIGKNIVYLGNEKCLAGGDIIVVKHSESPLFMSYALNSNYGQIQKSYGKAKLKVVHISGAEIGNIKVMLPPRGEQEQIEKYILKKCNEIDLLIRNKEQIIGELENYKKSVIYEYVTGKKEVV